MGAWGEKSYDCDCVMDNVSDLTDGVKTLTLAQSDKLLGKIKPTKYDITELVGTVIFMLERKYPVSKKYLNKTLKDANAALVDDGYLSSWGNPAKRQANLKKEITILQKALGVTPKPKTPKPKVLKHGEEHSITFDMDLGDLIDCGGIEGVNNIMDEAMSTKYGYSVSLTDISYEVSAHTKNSVTILASGLLDIQE